MGTLIEKLTAALDETEELATDAAEQVGDGNWRQRATGIVTAADPDREVADYAIVECIDHIVHNDPARVLRQVAAHRKLLDLAKVMHEDYYDNGADQLIAVLAETYGIEVE